MELQSNHRHQQQVIRSTGKHTNAISAFLEWANEHMCHFVKNRPLHFSREEKLMFFKALRDLCSYSMQSHQMERLHISNQVVSLLVTDSYPLETQKILSDLILVGLNKNGQYVNALATNYRLATPRSKSCNHKWRCTSQPVNNSWCMEHNYSAVLGLKL